MYDSLYSAKFNYIGIDEIEPACLKIVARNRTRDDGKMLKMHGAVSFRMDIVLIIPIK